MLFWRSRKHENAKIIEDKEAFQSDWLVKSRESSMAGPNHRWAGAKVLNRKDGIHPIRLTVKLNSKENEHPIILSLQHHHHECQVISTTKYYRLRFLDYFFHRPLWRKGHGAMHGDAWGDSISVRKNISFLLQVQKLYFFLWTFKAYVWLWGVSFDY